MCEELEQLKEIVRQLSNAIGSLAFRNIQRIKKSKNDLMLINHVLMVEEYEKLCERNKKLMNFIHSEEFKEIPLIKRRFLSLQNEVMFVYEKVLNLRLDMEMAELNKTNEEENQ